MVEEKPETSLFSVQATSRNVEGWGCLRAGLLTWTTQFKKASGDRNRRLKDLATSEELSGAALENKEDLAWPCLLNGESQKASPVNVLCTWQTQATAIGC